MEPRVKPIKDPIGNNLKRAEKLLSKSRIM